MNREIKFRGLKNKTWRYGYYNYETKSNISEIIYNNAGVSVEKESVGQFTGLFDKNGVEIYEGDIIHDTPQNLIVMFGKTKCVNGFALFEYTTDESGVCSITDLCCVIGNIHENPELLATI